MFAVAWVTQVPKKQFPIEEVHGNTTPQVWLITCGGDCDEAARPP
ncbi:hypothetical protein SAMN05216174_12219 [Actinokineospora iranica]|uniref:Uncharacterized protein n=1 Tax=Actinokineospora iranica TaxID=1271860 RepID=A0A1G6YLT2_9PSEU|nr:hypothetical protein SAMN05216174_12219 [Actinokineospora iranica]